MIWWCTQQNSYNYITHVRLHSWTTPHTAPLWVSCGVSFVRYTEKWPGNIETALYMQEWSISGGYITWSSITYSTQLCTNWGRRQINSLTHWGWDKMAANFLMTFSKAFCWMKIYKFQSKFHWNQHSSFCVNILRPRQDHRHFIDDIFKCLFL